jgi:hypothetical protein
MHPHPGGLHHELRTDQTNPTLEPGGLKIGDSPRELEVETTKLSTEREILQRAAKYFAGETNW